MLRTSPANLKKSNEQVSEIIGNTKKITDDLVSADFKSVITDARLDHPEIEYNYGRITEWKRINE